MTDKKPACRAQAGDPALHTDVSALQTGTEGLCSAASKKTQSKNIMLARPAQENACTVSPCTGQQTAPGRLQITAVASHGKKDLHSSGSPAPQPSAGLYTQPAFCTGMPHWLQPRTDASGLQHCLLRTSAFCRSVHMQAQPGAEAKLSRLLFKASRQGKAFSPADRGFRGNPCADAKECGPAAWKEAPSLPGNAGLP